MTGVIERIASEVTSSPPAIQVIERTSGVLGGGPTRIEVLQATPSGPQGPSGNANPADLISSDSPNALTLGTDGKLKATGGAPQFYVVAEGALPALPLPVPALCVELRSNGNRRLYFTDGTL
jgi:hypothetical protein